MFFVYIIKFCIFKVWYNSFACIWEACIRISDEFVSYIYSIVYYVFAQYQEDIHCLTGVTLVYAVLWNQGIDKYIVSFLAIIFNHVNYVWEYFQHINYWTSKIMQMIKQSRIIRIGIPKVGITTVIKLGLEHQDLMPWFRKK